MFCIASGSVPSTAAANVLLELMVRSNITDVVRSFSVLKKKRVPTDVNAMSHSVRVHTYYPVTQLLVTRTSQWKPRTPTAPQHPRALTQEEPIGELDTFLLDIASSSSSTNNIF